MPEYNLCRICLTENIKIEKLHILFDENGSACNDLVHKIEECGGIKLRPLKDIPSMLCFRCLESLDIAYKFRELCRASENAFIDPIIKTEVKAEYLDHLNNSHNEGNTSVVFDISAEYIEGEEVEMVDFTEAIIDNVLENDALIEEDNLKHEEDADVLDEDSDDYYLPNSSDTDYEPTELVKQKKKLKTSKNNHSKGSDSRKRYKRGLEDETMCIMCEICGNIYSKRGALNMHMRRHMSEKPFACELCSKTFAGPSELNRHIRVHTGEKPFSCRFCDRSFADRSSNIRHERTHTNERPFSCNTCGKSFSYSNVLKNHMLTHTGEKPFPYKFHCVDCNKTFSRKHQLEQHYATITHQATVKNRKLCMPNNNLSNHYVDE